MMFNHFTSSIPALAALLLSSVCTNALCLPCQAGAVSSERVLWSQPYPRDVYNPKITSPTSSTIWRIGAQVTVTWDTRSMPKSITNTKGKLVLGHIENENDGEHLDLKHPLADGFDITLGKITVTVPQVATRRDYIVVLFGDSGNRSPSFSIA